MYLNDIKDGSKLNKDGKEKRKSKQRNGHRKLKRKSSKNGKSHYSSSTRNLPIFPTDFDF